MPQTAVAALLFPLLLDIGDHRRHTAPDKCQHQSWLNGKNGSTERASTHDSRRQPVCSIQLTSKPLAVWTSIEVPPSVFSRPRSNQERVPVCTRTVVEEPLAAMAGDKVANRAEVLDRSEGMQKRESTC